MNWTRAAVAAGVALPVVGLLAFGMTRDPKDIPSPLPGKPAPAVELAKRGITVNAVAPGWVDTEMCVLPFADGGKARIEAAIPNGRVASAMDVAWTAVALCMPGARHIVGEIVNVNGGSVLAG